MKIGYLLPSVFTSTTQFPGMIFAPLSLMLSLADELINRDHEVVLFATDDIKTRAKVIGGDWNLFPGKLFQEKIKSAPPERRKWGEYYNLKREYELDLTEKAFAYALKNLDILHIYHDDYSHYFDELTQFPCVYTLHDPLPPKGSLEYWRFMKFKHHNYISISNDQRKNYDLNFVKTIYHGLDLNQYEFNQKAQDYLAYIGRVVPEKGVTIALDVAFQTKHNLKLAYKIDQTLQENPYYVNEVQPKIKKYHAQEVGFVSGKAQSDFYKNAKAVLFPIQWSEPFGLVMIEAMACGTPVIAFNKGSVSEIVKNRVTGFIVDNENEMKHAVSQLDTIDRQACRHYVEQHFSIQKMAKEHLKVYSQILT